MSAYCNLTGEDGNAHAIIGRVARALKEAGVPREEIETYRARAMSGSYDDLLQTSMRVLDDNGIDYD
jgi:hypothetical protein